MSNSDAIDIYETGIPLFIPSMSIADAIPLL